MKLAYRNLAIVLSLTAPGAVMATNGYQLIGIGAYQKSLGGAVTANPGSAMTAVSNPAGMTRIGKRADFSMEAFMPERSTDFGALGGENVDSAQELYGVPAIGWTAPASDDNDRIWLGGGMYGTSGLGVDYEPTLMMPNSPMVPGNPDVYWDGYSSIAFWQMAPTIAWNQSEKLSLGASLNIDYQSVAFSQRFMADTDADGAGDTTISNFNLGRSTSAFGLGLSLGLIYDVNDRLSLGLAYKSEQNFSELEYQLARGDITNTQTGAPLPAGTYKLDLDYPQQISAGVAFRAMPKLTLSADLKWIEWSATMGDLTVEGPEDFALDPGWDDQIVYAVGLAYDINDRATVRVGYNHGDVPFDDDKVSRNLILPAVVEDHYTVGGDYRFNNHWELGFHYMYAPENTLTAPADDPFAPGTEISLGETSFGINVGYRF